VSDHEYARPAPVEGKVKAATVGAAGGGAVGAFVLWLLGVFIWGAPGDADSATLAISAVPAPVAGVVLLGIPALVAYGAGYRAKHTRRDDPASRAR
jgi:hypothetical protein